MLLGLSILISELLLESFINLSATVETGRFFSEGPKLYENSDVPFSDKSSAAKYPTKGSKTCCHGLVLSEFLKTTSSFFDQNASY